MLADGQAMQHGPEVKEASPGGNPTAEMLASRKGYQRAGDQNITEGLHQGQLCGSPRWGGVAGIIFEVRLGRWQGPVLQSLRGTFRILILTTDSL